MVKPIYEFEREQLEKMSYVYDGDGAVAQRTVGSSSSGASAGGNSILIGKDIGSTVFDASAKTITFNGLGILSLGQIQSIVNLNSNKTIYSPGNTSTGGTLSSNVLTLNYDTTSMNDTDELQVYVYYVNSEDYSLSAEKNIVQNPLWAHRTSVQPLVSASNIGASNGVYVDQGNEISCDTYNTLGLGVKFTVNDSVTNTIKVLTKLESGATNEYILETSGDYIKTLGDSNIVIFYPFTLGNVVKSVQVQSAAGTVGATPGTLDIEYTLGWS